MNVNFKFYIIEFTKKLPREDINKYVCIPDSWIRMRNNEFIVVKYPVEDDAQTKLRVSMNENFSVDWSLFDAVIKYKTDSYNDALHQIIILNRKSSQEWSYAQLTKEKKLRKSKTTLPSKSERKKPETYVPSLNCAAEKRKPNVILNESILDSSNIKTNSYGIQNRPREVNTQSSVINFMNQNTISTNKENRNELQTSVPKCARNSKGNENKANDTLNSPYTTKEHSTRKVAYPTFVTPAFINKLKILHSDFEKTHKNFDQLRICFIQQCSVLEEMIQLSESFYNLNIDPTTNSASVATVPAPVVTVPTPVGTVTTPVVEVATPVVEVTTPVTVTPPARQIVIENQTAKMREQKPKVTVRHEKQNLNCDEEVQVRYDDDIIIDSEVEAIPKKIRVQSVNVASLPENEELDTKWTLRHRVMRDDLCELLPNTGVYVNEDNLKSISHISSDKNTLARMLLTEVFSESALKVCTMTGRKSGGRSTPGLDKDAMLVLLRYIDMYALEKCWPQSNPKAVIYSIRNKIYDIKTRLNLSITC